MEGLGSTNAIKGLSEGIHTNVEILKEWNSDLSDSMAKKLGDIKDKLGSPVLSQDSLSKVNLSVEKVNSQLAAMRTLLVDALTVVLTKPNKLYDFITFRRMLRFLR